MVKWDKLVVEWPKRDWAIVWRAVRCFFLHRTSWYTDMYADLSNRPAKALCRKCGCWWPKGRQAVDLTHIAPFVGKWIALDEQDRICGVGETPGEAMAEAKSRNYARPLLMFVSEYPPI